MRRTVQTLAIPILTAVLLSCGSEREAPPQGDPDVEPGKGEPRQPAAGKGPASKRGEAQGAADTAGGASFLAPVAGAPADHKPIGAEDREVLSQVYLSFAEDPEGFVEQVQQLAPDRRERIAGYLMCAAGKLHTAANPDKAGAPIQVELPIEARELIRYEGPPERGRTMFLRQLGGEFLVVGRSIQSIDRGDVKTVEQILARQRQNLEMMKIASGPEKAAEWSATMRRVFPILFARLIPEC
jgi:hypothetical protein